MLVLFAELCLLIKSFVCVCVLGRGLYIEAFISRYVGEETVLELMNRTFSKRSFQGGTPILSCPEAQAVKHPKM